MKLLAVALLFAVVAVVCGDCGCLKCGKNLRVVSPPQARVKVIYRGESCNCPKPIPYSVHIPKPVCKECPTRTYGYQVQRIKFRQPKEHIKYSYDCEVQEPIKKTCGCKYLYGLVASPDRVVMPAVDDCVPEKPCSSGPIIEYLPTKCEEESNDYYYPKPYFRNKRHAPFTLPKRRPFRQHLQDQNEIWQRPKYELAKVKVPLRPKAARATQSKPFRLSLPIDSRRRAFPFRRPKPKSQTLGAVRAPFVPVGRAREPEQQRLVKALRDTGKFADLQNVEICDLPGAKVDRKGRQTPDAPGAKAGGIFAKRRRQARSIQLADDSLPFYKISELDGEAIGGDFAHANEVVVRRKPRDPLMQPFDIESMIPHEPIFYMLNAPIRALNHMHRIRKHVDPVVKSVPQVIDASSNYITNFGKKLKTSAFNLVGTFADSLGNFPGKGFLDILIPIKRNGLIRSRSKRTILKVVDEDDVHDFLREKLSIFSEDKEEDDNDDLLRPVTPESVKAKSKVQRADSRRKSGTKKLVLEQLMPKLFLDKGKPLVEVNGRKKPIAKPGRKRPSKILRAKEPDRDLKEAIDEIIEEARQMGTQQHNQPKALDEMPLQVIKSKMTHTLDDIDRLVNADFEPNASLYENLLRLQNLKDFVTDSWKNVLVNKKHDDVGEKIRLLNKFLELQSLKDEIFESIADGLLEEENFNTNNLVKMLVRLQKLQCVLMRVVEDFGEKIKFQTPFDVQKEIAYVDYLQKIYFVSGKNSIEIGRELQRERDAKLQKEIALLDNLKHLLEAKTCEKNAEKINEVAKVLWEIKNVEKIQKNTVLELNDKIQSGQKIRRELKIIFDLQKQVEICETKLKELFDSLKKCSKSEKDKNEGTATEKYPNRFKKLKITLPKKQSYDIFKNRKPLKKLPTNLTAFKKSKTEE